MTIKYNYINDKYYIEQTATKPLIYLDNWAINFLATDISLQKEFLKLVVSKNATVAFSAINLLEIVNRTDEEQISSIIKFCEHIINDAVIESNPLKVITREKQFTDSRLLYESMPWTHTELIMILGLHGRQFKRLSVAETIYCLNAQIKSTGKKYDEKFENELFPQVRDIRNNQEKLHYAKKNNSKGIILKKDNFPYTTELYDYFLNFIVCNETMKMGNSEWRDLFHAIVPVSYCDFVLIDKRWVNCIKHTKISSPSIAKVYSRNALKEFFNDFKNYK